MNTKNENNDILALLKRVGVVKAGSVALLIVLLFAPAMQQLIQVWKTKEDYSHGFFVIPIALYFVWTKREKLLSLESRPSWAGLPIFLVGTVIYLISLLVRFHTLTYLSMVAVIFGLILFLGGWGLTKLLLPPVLFLLFMFPIPESYYVMLTNPLKLMITKVSTQIIYIIGIPVYREGNLLYLASTQLEVAEACSGVRSLYSYLMLGCIFASMSRRRINMAILLLSTIPLAVFVNVVRVAGTGILSHYFGAEVAQGFFHEFAGFILFVIGFVFLLFEYQFLERGQTPDADSSG